MSTQAGSCPQTEVFVEFLNGDLSQSAIETLEAHLSQCAACGDTLRAMNVDDTLLSLARSAEPLADEEAQLVDRLVAKLQRLQPIDQSGQTTLDEDVQSRAEEVRQLLAQAEEADELGRLAHFRILRLLGAGGMGVVYQAEDLQLRRLVALKVLRPSLGTAARERFLHEARAAAAIDHDQVITIYQVDRAGPLAFIAMQWLKGETLECRLQREGTLPLQEVEEIGRQIAQGLAAAHGKGLIHRDIKPANIWLEADRSRARILDFGLARTVDDNPQLTETGMIAGTPAYMSPEQSQGRDVDERSDLFSLGCVLYRAVTGRFPFQASNALAMLRAIQQEQPVSPRDVGQNVSRRMSDLIMWLLAKVPTDRPVSAEAWLGAVDDPQITVPQAFTGAHVNHEDVPMAQAKSKAGGSHSRWWGWAAALIILGAFGSFAAPTIIRVVTNQGELVIKTDDPGVQVEVLDQGNTVRLVDLRTKQSVSIDVPAGEYRIHVSESSGDVKLSQNKVTLYRGGRELVEVVKVEPSPDATALTPTTDLEQLQGRWELISFWDGGRRARGRGEKPWLLEINGDHVTLKSDSEVDFHGTLELDEARKTVDFNVVDSPDTEAVTRRGIYKIGGLHGTLTICLGMDFRPTSFQPGENIEIASFQRVDESAPALAASVAMDGVGSEDTEQPATRTEKTYGGITLSSWLDTAERERSPSELQLATMALAALGDAEHAEACARAVLKMMRVHGTRNPADGVGFMDDPRLSLNFEARRDLYQMSPAGVVKALAAEIDGGNERSHAFMAFVLPTTSSYILNTDFADYQHLRAELKRAHKPLVEQLLNKSVGGTAAERRWAVEFLALLCHAVDIDCSSVEGLVPRLQSELTSSNGSVQLAIAECLVPAAPDSPGLAEALLHALDEPETELCDSITWRTGPQAAAAVPALCKRIRQFSQHPSSNQVEMQQVHEVLVALAKMGSAARDALPELQLIAQFETNSPTQQRLLVDPARAAIDAIESAPVSPFAVQFRIVPNPMDAERPPRADPSQPYNLAAKSEDEFEFSWVELHPDANIPAGPFLREGNGNRYLLVANTPPYILTIEQRPNEGMVEKVELQRDTAGRASLLLTLDPVAAQRMKKISQANLGNQLAILIDGKVVYAARIRSEISSRVSLSGFRTIDELRAVLPAKSPSQAESVRELEKLIQLNEELRDIVVARHEEGRTPFSDVVAAEINVVEARLRLSELQNDSANRKALLDELWKLHDQKVEAIKTQYDAGVVTQAVLREAEKALIEARLRYGVNPNDNDNSKSPPPGSR